MKIYKPISYILVFTIPLHAASAQWNLPVNDFNLPNNFDLIVLKLTNWVLGFIVSIAVLAIIWGGIKYEYSLGDQQTANDAKRIIKYALMGLVIAGISYALVNVFVTKIIKT